MQPAELVAEAIIKHDPQSNDPRVQPGTAETFGNSVSTSDGSVLIPALEKVAANIDGKPSGSTSPTADNAQVLAIAPTQLSPSGALPALVKANRGQDQQPDAASTLLTKLATASNESALATYKTYTTNQRANSTPANEANNQDRNLQVAAGSSTSVSQLGKVSFITRLEDTPQNQPAIQLIRII